jgi:hypothetical protein
MECGGRIFKHSDGRMNSEKQACSLSRIAASSDEYEHAGAGTALNLML